VRGTWASQPHFCRTMWVHAPVGLTLTSRWAPLALKPAMPRVMSELEEDELDEVALESTHTIDVEQFVETSPFRGQVASIWAWKEKDSRCIVGSSGGLPSRLPRHRRCVVRRPALQDTCGFHAECPGAGPASPGRPGPFNLLTQVDTKTAVL